MGEQASGPATLRGRLGRAGIWVSGPSVGDPGELAAWVEDTGFTGMWVGGGNPDETAFGRLEAMLSRTTRLVVATGIVNLWAWEPEALATAAGRLHAEFPGRLLLGIGVSHAPLVESMGRRYERPFAAMVAYLDALDAADARGAGAADARGAGTTGQPPRVLAALGDRMLHLAADRSAGAHPYLTTPEHTARARAVLGPEALLAPEQTVVLEEKPERARARARAFLERYLRLPNYTRNLRRLGWRAEDLAGSGSDALVDALVAHGSPAEVLSGIRAHLEAGADHVCIQALAEGPAVDRAALEALAPSLRA